MPTQIYLVQGYEQTWVQCPNRVTEFPPDFLVELTSWSSNVDLSDSLPGWMHNQQKARTPSLHWNEICFFYPFFFFFFQILAIIGNKCVHRDQTQGVLWKRWQFPATLQPWKQRKKSCWIFPMTVQLKRQLSQRMICTRIWWQATSTSNAWSTWSQRVSTSVRKQKKNWRKIWQQPVQVLQTKVKCMILVFITSYWNLICFLRHFNKQNDTTQICWLIEKEKWTNIAEAWLLQDWSGQLGGISVIRLRKKERSSIRPNSCWWQIYRRAWSERKKKLDHQGRQKVSFSLLLVENWKERKKKPRTPQNLARQAKYFAAAVAVHWWGGGWWHIRGRWHFPLRYRFD